MLQKNVNYCDGGLVIAGAAPQTTVQGLLELLQSSVGGLGILMPEADKDCDTIMK